MHYSLRIVFIIIKMKVGSERTDQFVLECSKYNRLSARRRRILSAEKPPFWHLEFLFVSIVSVIIVKRIALVKLLKLISLRLPVCSNVTWIWLLAAQYALQHQRCCGRHGCQ